MEYERKRGMIVPILVPADKGPIAIVGSGPAGLGCAAKLASLGYKVKVFEKDGRIGGLLTSTIPSFRLPKEVVEFEIEFIKKLGVEFVTDKKIDDPRLLFKQGFKAIFIGTGLVKSRVAEFIGEDRPGVFQALDFLRSAKLGKIPDMGRRVLVIGGGDTAIDSARVAKRAGTECFILYRRMQNEMPAYEEELDAAWHDGVEFYFRVIPRSVVGKDRIEGLKCVRVKWHEKIAGMKQGYDVEGPEFTISCDSVIVAAGQEPETNFGLRSGSSGLIALEKDSFKTSEKFIYAGGDITCGGGTAARAVGMGKLAAIEIDSDLSSA
jgi:NADPH-dependent glutamate synthase beta subunit-like oxidoreductase